jgi:DNA invertase Pin-like site-specific DNA recombinase
MFKAVSDAAGSAPADRRAVAVYARKSNKTEGRSKSVSQQIEICEKTRELLNLPGDVRIYSEGEGFKGEWFWEDAAGRNPKPWRPELTRLVRDIERGEVGAVMVWRSDRLYRDPEVSSALVRVFLKHNVRLFLGPREVKPGSADGYFHVTMEAANNRRWRDQISEDVRRDHELKAKLGMFTRNPSCLGFRSKGRKSQAVEPVDSELALVRRIFRLYVHGEDGEPPMSTTGIAKKLMREGVVVSVGAKGHKVKDSRVVHESQIRIILSNPMYVGMWKHNEEINDCPALRVCGPSGRDTAIPVELFEAAQAKLARPKSKNEKARYSHHLLTGLVVCGGCGRPMQLGSKRGSDARVFRCSNKHLGCPRGASVGVRESILNDWVLDTLLPLVRNSLGQQSEASDAQALLAEKVTLEARVQELLGKEGSQLAELLGKVAPEQIAAIAGELRAARSVLEQRLRQVQEKLSQAAEADGLADKTVRELSPAKLKQTLMTLLRWVALTKEGVVCYTRTGAVIAAHYDESQLLGYKAAGGARLVGEPSVASAACCAEWFACPQLFVQGRRHVLGNSALGLADTELLPFAIDQHLGDTIDA